MSLKPAYFSLVSSVHLMETCSKSNISVYKSKRKHIQRLSSPENTRRKAST